MACAIHCARHFGKGSVILVEKQSRPGRKLLAAGNGRCNISNEDLSLSHYHGEAALYTSVLERFPLEKALDFFQSLGLVLRADEAGRLYPYSNRGSSVFGRLQAELERLQVELLLDHPVSAIQKQKNGFRLISETDTILAQYVVLCCGSKACPSLGADDSVLTLLKPFSIRYSPFFPSLSPIMTLEKHKMLKGVRAAGKVWVTADGKALPAKEGEIQFTETGLSGICVFEISRLVHEYLTFGTVRGKEIHSLKVTADVVPDMSFQQLNEYLKSCRKLFCYEPADRLFSGLLPEKLSEYIAAGCKIQQRSCGELGDGTIKKMASQAKTMSLMIASPNFSLICWMKSERWFISSNRKLAQSECTYITPFFTLTRCIIVRKFSGSNCGKISVAVISWYSRSR